MILYNFRFNSWAEEQPSGNGGCVGYSSEHNLFWDDFSCENISALIVGFLCQDQGNRHTNTSKMRCNFYLNILFFIFEFSNQGKSYYGSIHISTNCRSSHNERALA